MAVPKTAALPLGDAPPARRIHSRPAAPWQRPCAGGLKRRPPIQYGATHALEREGVSPQSPCRARRPLRDTMIKRAWADPRPETGLAACTGARLAGPQERRYNPPHQKQRLRSVAQSGSAPRSGRGGRRFKSCHSDHSEPTFQGVVPCPAPRQRPMRDWHNSGSREGSSGSRLSGYFHAMPILSRTIV
jgi:hypothetical protein